MADLKQLFRTAVASSMDTRGKPAILGKIDGTLYWSSSRRDMVWARVGEPSSFQEMVVRCTKVTPQYDMPVRVDLINDTMTVIDVDDKRYLEFSGNRPGGSVGAHAWLHGRLGPDPLYITGLQYLPLLVVPTNPAALTVTVHQGAYRWDGTYKIFEETTSGSLSSYIPGSSGGKHFVIIALDRVNNTIVIVDGDDLTTGSDALFSGITLMPGDVTAVSIDDAYLPLAAVLLYNGQTEVRAADIVMHLRPEGGEDFVGASTGIAEPPDDAATYGRKTDTTSSWVEVVPKAGGAFTGAVSISSGGLTVEGGAVFNESGAAVVHRFEGDGNANLVYIDGVNDRFGVGITPTVPLHSFGTVRHEFSTGQYMAITDTGIGGLRFTVRDSSDNLDQFNLAGDDVIIAAGSGSGNGTAVVRAFYDGALKLGFFAATPVAQQTAVKATTALQNLGLGTSLTDYVAATGGTFSGAVAISSGGFTVEGGAIFNDAGAAVVHRFEGDTDANLVYIDGVNDRFGVGTSSPQAKAHIEGSLKLGASTPTITPNTSDGSDNTIMGMGGGGAVSSTRGGYFQFFGNEFAGVPSLAGNVLFEAGNVSTGFVRFYTQAAQRMYIHYDGSVVVGSPTGANKGAGTINAQAVYDDNTLLSDHILDLYYDGRVRQSDAVCFPKARLWNIEQTAVFTKQNRHLPTMPGRAEWESSGSKSLGKMITALWETVEQQQIMIFELNDRLKAVANG